jgi:succinate dehydrogenase/fumarate reductase flavoprotein subunit
MVEKASDSRVELPVGLVGNQLLVAEEVAGSLGLLGEGDHVGRAGELPVLVAPELASCAEALRPVSLEITSDATTQDGRLTSLDLVHNHDGAVLLGDVTQALEEGGGGVVVTALALDGLDNQAGHGAVPLEKERCVSTLLGINSACKQTRLTTR